MEKSETATDQRKLFCVGMAKTGTHSVAAMFDGRLKAAQTDRGQVRLAIAKLIKLHDLDVNSSQLNVYILDHLLELFPGSRFLLTIRPPREWLDSLIDHCINYEAAEQWKEFRDMRFGGKARRAGREEKPLQRHGLYSLEGYFSYWRWHNERVLTTVPKNRLKIVQTSEIGRSAVDIARFGGFSDESLLIEKTHEFKATKKHYVLSEIDPDYLNAQISEYCGPLADENFSKPTCLL